MMPSRAQSKMARISGVRFFRLFFRRDTASPPQTVEKCPSAAFPSSFVVATYLKVRLTPQNFGCLASGPGAQLCPALQGGKEHTVIGFSLPGSTAPWAGFTFLSSLQRRYFQQPVRVRQPVIRTVGYSGNNPLPCLSGNEASCIRQAGEAGQPLAPRAPCPFWA